ncbi:MAG: hypothetical protein QME52_10420 [Bacteroidota bacterium]|nr:hypothetical protein [Bacteroidota bacterium]
MMSLLYFKILCFVILLTLFGCYSDDKYPVDQLLSTTFTSTGDTSYVEITPSFSGFNNPTAILAGNDQLIYVADTDNNRLVQMNEAGIILETREILKPIAIAQDLRLDLLVGGCIFRETIGDTIAAVFRIHLFEANHHISLAQIDTIWKESAKPNRRFRGIGVLLNNQYFVVRDGPDNSSYVDPDSRLLWFDKFDKLITPLGDLTTRAGSGITDILRTTGIATFPNSNDFVLTQSSVGGIMSFGALWLVYTKQPDFEGWLPKFDPRRPEDKYRDFIKPNRFVEASATAIDGSRLDIFIIDSALDSLIKFDRRGNFKSESFGNTALKFLDRPEFKSPKGVTYRNKTLYITDSGNNIVRRFRLSTDR